MTGPSSTAGFPAGTAATTWTPGDLLACRNLARWWTRQGVSDAAIRFGQRLKAWHPSKGLDRAARKAWRAKWRAACWASHIACVVGVDGTLVEMLAAGAQVTNASGYAAVDYTVISPLPAGDPRRALAVEYWRWLAQEKTKYGWWTLPVDVIALVTGLRIGFSVDGRPVCSQAAAAGIGLDEWRTNPAAVTPADVTFRFAAAPPA